MVSAFSPPPCPPSEPSTPASPACLDCRYVHMDDEGYTECRRSAPTHAVGAWAGWLRVQHDDWCGEFDSGGRP